jgi:hypothetical protein
VILTIRYRREYGATEADAPAGSGAARYRGMFQFDEFVCELSRLSPVTNRIRAPGCLTVAVQAPARVNVIWVTPLGEEVASIS